MKKIVYLSLIAASFAFDVNAAQGNGGTAVFSMKENGKSTPVLVTVGGQSSFTKAMPSVAVALPSRPLISGSSSGSSLIAMQKQLLLKKRKENPVRKMLTVEAYTTGDFGKDKKFSLGRVTELANKLALRTFSTEMLKDIQEVCKTYNATSTEDKKITFKMITRGAGGNALGEGTRAIMKGLEELTVAEANKKKLSAAPTTWPQLVRPGNNVICLQNRTNGVSFVPLAGFAATYLQYAYNVVPWENVVRAFLFVADNPILGADGAKLAKLAGVVNGIATFVVDPVTGQPIARLSTKDTDPMFVLATGIGLSASIVKTLYMGTLKWWELSRILGVPLTPKLWDAFKFNGTTIESETGLKLDIPKTRAEVIAALPAPAGARPTLPAPAARLALPSSSSEGLALPSSSSEGLALPAPTARLALPSSGDVRPELNSDEETPGFSTDVRPALPAPTDVRSELNSDEGTPGFSDEGVY